MPGEQRMIVSNREYFLNNMPKFNRSHNTLSEWLAKLELRLEMAGINDDREKINFCTLHIGPTGEDILAAAALDSWEEAKELLTQRLGEGTEAEKAYKILKKVNRGGRDLAEVGAQIDRLVRKAYPDQPEHQQRHGIEAFMKAIDPALARKVREQGQTTLTEVLATARRLEQLDEEFPSPGFDSFAAVMHEEMRQLRKELKELKEQNASVKMAQIPATPAPSTPPPAAAAAMAVSPPTPFYPPLEPHPLPAPAAPAYLAPPPIYPPGPSPYQHPPGNRNRRRPQPSPRYFGGRCFLCDEEGHFVAQCPIKLELQRAHRRQTAPPGAAADPTVLDAQNRPSTSLN